MNQSSHKVSRLYWGENYAPKPKMAIDAISAAYKAAYQNINLYPGGLQDEALVAISMRLGIPTPHILISNGIEGLIQLLCKTFVRKGDEVIMLNPTFGGYAHNAQIVGAHPVFIDVVLGSYISVKDVTRCISKNTSIIFIASPNTMTGFYHLTIQDIAKLAGVFPGIIVIDECYFGIGDMTVVSLVKKFSNIIILQSASKSLGLAGIRVGWAIASQKIITQLKKYSIALAPDPLPSVSYAVLAAVMPFSSDIAHSFILFRDEFAFHLAKIKNFHVYPTDTTMIPVVLPKSISISKYIALMKSEGVLLKDTSNVGYLLVGVPPKREWKYVLSCFQGVISSFG